MTVDLHSLRRRLRILLRQRVEACEAAWDPFSATWLAYAALRDGAYGNQALADLTGLLERWSKGRGAWLVRKNLGSLCFVGYLQLTGKRTDEDLLQQLVELLERERGRERERFSPLSDADQIYLASMFAGHYQDVPEAIRELLKGIARGQSRGSWKRRLMCAASLRELGVETTVALPDASSVTEPADLFAIAWYGKRYQQPAHYEPPWQAVERALDEVDSGRGAGEAVGRALGDVELALVLEAVALETDLPDPRVLFDYYPLHPRVRAMAEKLFRQGEIWAAVEEAAKALNQLIQSRTGCDLSERKLVQATMRGKNPLLLFNTMLHTQSGRDEQDGLALVAEGVFAGFRHPKAHSPKDSPLLAMEPLEALDQLVTIGYLFKRVERAMLRSGGST